MYFCTEEGVYKPSNNQSLYSFCADLTDEYYNRQQLKSSPRKFDSVVGKYDDVLLLANADTTTSSLVTAYNNYKLNEQKHESKESEPVCVETVTMAKIYHTLFHSGLEYWTYYNPEDGTHIIKFGKDLKLDD